MKNILFQEPNPIRDPNTLSPSRVISFRCRRLLALVRNNGLNKKRKYV